MINKHGIRKNIDFGMWLMRDFLANGADHINFQWKREMF